MSENPNPGSSPFFLDCDTGIDDAMAIAYLLATEGVNLVGIGSVAGNVSAAVGARNTLDLLSLAGRTDIPVAVGAADWLTEAFDGGSLHVHGNNGVGNVELPHTLAEPIAETAPQLLVRLAREYAGELHVLAIGPCTNLAIALDLEPSLPSLVKHLTVMGGAAMVAGNISPLAEANIGHDPEAAARVFEAGWPITMVGLDVTMNHTFSEANRDALLASRRPVARAIGEMLDVYFDFYVDIFGVRVCALHDPLAIAIAVGDVVPKLAPVVSVVVDETSGPGRGHTVCDFRGRFLGYPAQPGAHCAVVLELDEPFAPLLLGTLLRA